MHSLGVADELCGRTSGIGGTPRSRHQGWWAGEVAKAVGGGEREAWKTMEGFRDRGCNHPPGLRHLHGQKKPAWRAVDRARRNTEE